LIVLLLVSVSYLEPLLLIAPLAAFFGIAGTVITIGLFQCLVRAIRVSRCLQDGRAIYLMPGAFTHVLVHDALPSNVFLVKRGRQILKRHIKNMGPRHSLWGEWQAYRALKKADLAAETYYVGSLPIDCVQVALGGNLRVDALKGEERFLADRTTHDTLRVCLQEKGIPLNEFLRLHPEERDVIYDALCDVVRSTWRHGYVDLDVALRNYMVRLDHQGRPLRRSGRYVVLIHDFGSTFRCVGDTKTVEDYLHTRGQVADAGPAAIANGAFLLRSLTRRREIDFARQLLPHTDLHRLSRVFHGQDEAIESLRVRLRHYSSVQPLRDAYRSIAEAVTEARQNDSP
jgi:hypothetical protein